jgi:hypothetical protein
MAEVTKVYGVRETMNELRKVSPALYRETMKQMKSAAAPMVSAVKGSMPAGAPLSGMEHKGRTGWSTPKVSVRYGGRAPRFGNTETIPLLRIRVDGVAPVMADMAANGQTTAGLAMVAALGGSPSRYAWPGAESQQGRVTAEVLQACENVMRETNQHLVTRHDPGV